MPRYYFDLREGETFAPDKEGQEFADLDSAEYEAACTAAQIGRERLPASDVCDVTGEVKNEYYRRVVTVTVSMTITRTEPAREDA